jgi:hypothetical protein
VSALRVGGAIGAAGSAVAGIAVFTFARPVWPLGVELIVFAGLLLVGSTFERWRYKAKIDPNHGTFAPTGEVFDDPISGERMRVFYDEKTGERAYEKTTS